MTKAEEPTRKSERVKSKPTADYNEDNDIEQVAKKAKTTASPQKGLKVGETLPDFEFTNQDGESVTLHQLTKDNGVVIFMYPKANTPGCTTQACSFRDSHDKFVAKGYQIFGLSADSPKSQLNWKTKHSFPYDLLCDPERKAIKAFGAAKSPSGIKRSHIVLGKGAVVEDVQIQVSPKVSIEKALEFVVGAEEEAPKSPKKEEAPKSPVKEAPKSPKKEETPKSPKKEEAPKSPKKDDAPKSPAKEAPKSPKKE